MSRAARKTLTVLTIAAVVTVAVAGGAWSASRALVNKTDVYTDDDAIVAVADLAAPRDVLWRPSEKVAIGAHDEDVYEPHVSFDGTTMLVVKGSPGGGADLYESKRSGAGWSEAVPIVGVNTDADEMSPYLSRDGGTLYFATDRAGGLGGYDIWTARRTDDGWSEPTPLGETVNSQLNEYGPTLTHAGDLIFASNRPRPDELAPLAETEWPGSLGERFRDHDYDIYRVDPEANGAAMRIAELSTPQNDVAPAVSPAGDFVYFGSDRLGGFGGFDLYRVRVTGDGFGEIEHLDESINTDANELDPSLSFEGFGLHFSSNRGLTEAERVRDRFGVYFTTSREVFRRTDITRARIDWSALWAAIWPWLTSLIAALLLLWILSYLSKPEVRRRWRTLSLMAKCVIVSLLAHALLLLLFTALHVTTGIGDLISRPESRVQIVSSASRSGGIQQQINSELTEFRIDPAQSSATPRNESSVETASAPSSVEVAPGQMAVRAQRVVQPEMDESDAVRSEQPVDMAKASPMQMDQSVETPTDARVVTTNEAEQALPQTTPPTQTVRAEMTESVNESQDARHTTRIGAMPVPVQIIDHTIADADGASPERATELARNAPVEVTDSPSASIETPRPSRIETAVEPSHNISADTRSLATTTTAELRVETTTSASTDMRPESGLTPAPTGSLTSASPSESRSETSHDAPHLTQASRSDPAINRVQTPGDVGRAARATESVAGVNAVLASSSPTAEIRTGESADTRVEVNTAPSAIVDARLTALGTIHAPSESRTVANGDAPTLADSHTISSDTTELSAPTEIGAPARSAEAAAGITAIGASSSPTVSVDANAAPAGSSRVAVDSVPVEVADSSKSQSDGSGAARESAHGARSNDVRLASAEQSAGSVSLLTLEPGSPVAEPESQSRSPGGRSIKTTSAHAPSGALVAGSESTNGRVDVVPSAPMISEIGVSYASADAPIDASPTRSLTVRGSEPSVDAPGIEIATIEPDNHKAASSGGPKTGAAGVGAALVARTTQTPGAQTSMSDHTGSPVKNELFSPAEIKLTDTGRAERASNGASIADARPRGRSRVASSSQFRSNQPGPGVLAMPTELGAPVVAAPAPSRRNFTPTRSSPSRSPTPRNRESSPARTQSQLRIDPMRITDSRVSRDTPARESTGARTIGAPSVSIALPGAGIGGLSTPTEQLDPNQMFLSGVVLDAETREPIEGAIVGLDAEGRASLRVRTDASGRYSLSPANVPAHVAVTASAKGYTPDARNVSAKSLKQGARAVFLLSPERLEIAVLEPDPKVHHLGNDEFKGSINSQFQKPSEGIVYSRRFVLEQSQVAPAIKRAEIRLLAKGAQTRNEIRVNGRLVERRLTGSPDDGSFGEIRARFPVKWLRAGSNTIEIKSVRERGTDLDDFEFVNIRIHLERARPSSAL